MTNWRRAFYGRKGLVRRADDIAEIKCSRNTAVVTLGQGVDIDFEGARRNFT